MTSSALDSAIVQVEPCLSQLIALWVQTDRRRSKFRLQGWRLLGEKPSLVALTAPESQLA